jgi:hypothetical protein
MQRDLLLCIVLAASTTAEVAAQLIVRPAGVAPGEEALQCVPERKPCVYTDLQGDNRYQVDKDTLSRTADGQQAYALKLADGIVKVLATTINKQRTQIALATEQASIATGARLFGGGLTPQQVERQYSVSLRNPKSGEEIKAIDLGMLKPDSLALTATGDYLWVAGEERQLRRREVRGYNTRSGKMEHSTAADRNANIGLYERGFRVGNTFYAADLDTGGAVRRHNSPNSFSIAEFTVRRPTSLSPKTLGDAAIGVVGFQGGAPNLRDMLESALAIKVSSAGMKVVERQRLKDLLQEAQFQNLGLTDSSKATELGKLANAQYLLFGQIQTAGSVSSLGLRLVRVEDGTLVNGVELECRDCTPDDYLQGLTFMMQDWIEPGQ